MFSYCSTVPTSSAPLPPDSAAQKARDDATRSGVRTPDDKIPLVTVEQAPNGKPVFNKTSVASADEAGQVAGQQAQSGRVVAVEVASTVNASLVGPDPLRTQQWALDQVPYEQAWTTGNTKGAGITVKGDEKALGEALGLMDIGYKGYAGF